MPWVDDSYIRKVLDSRQRWGTVLSVTAVAGLFVFLGDHRHEPWLDLGPLAVGLLGTLYVLVVSSYYEQAEAIARERDGSGAEGAANVRKRWALSFARRIGLLGWMHILAPVVVGLLGAAALHYGSLAPLHP